MEAYKDLTKLEVYNKIMSIPKDKYFITVLEEGAEVYRFLGICETKKQALSCCSTALKMLPEAIVTMGSFGERIYTHSFILSELGIISKKDLKQYLELGMI
jgi:hypothetical protein